MLSVNQEEWGFLQTFPKIDLRISKKLAQEMSQLLRHRGPWAMRASEGEETNEVFPKPWRVKIKL